VIQDSGNRSKGDSILQSFSLGPEESIVALLPIVLKERLAARPPQHESESPEESTEGTGSTTTTSPEDSSLSSGTASPTDAFAQTVRIRQRSARARCARVCRRLRGLVVTGEAVYLLEARRDPATAFLELATTGGQENVEAAGDLATAFELESKPLLELAADSALCAKDFTAAIALYRQVRAQWGPWPVKN